MMPDHVQAFDLQGHRGARGLRPENTMPAFRRALELGVATLEMDVVVAADGTVVVSHEPWFSHVICRAPDGSPIAESEAVQHRIYALPYDEVEHYDCGTRLHPRFPHQELQPAAKPRLRDVIEMAEQFVQDRERPPVRYNIETKSTPAGDGLYHPDPETFTTLLYDVLVETGVKGRSTVQSFDVRTLQVARRLDPHWRTSLLVEWTPDHDLDDALATLGFTPAICSPDHRLVDAALVRAVHERGMHLIPWTANDVGEMRRLVQLGVDGFITDYPDRAQQLLEEISAR